MSAQYVVERSFPLAALIRRKAGDAAPPHKFAASFVAGMSMQEVLFAYDDGAGGVRVLESLLRYDPPDRDISWMRMPILFVGLIVVFGFQILRKNGGGRGGGAFGKLGGGRGGISDVDMDAINQMAERMGRNGEGGDMAAAMAGLGGMGGGGMGGGGFRGGAAGGRMGPMGGGGRRGRGRSSSPQVVQPRRHLVLRRQPLRSELRCLLRGE